MKYAIPEISWHNRDPVLSVDIQPKCANGDPLRLATGGTDTHVVIWYISTTATGSVHLEVAADLTRHQKAVNAVRWAPSGELLASGDDESIIFVWKQKTEEPTPVEGEEQYKESWVIHKTLRGHMEDVLDICWSPSSLQLASGSVDNKLLLWDVHKGRYSSIITDHKGFVQGVSWDPKGQYLVTASSDRVFRTFDISTKKVVARSSKASLPFPTNHPLHDMTVRLYHDDTLQTYYRRLSFSPDGLLVAVPGGKIEPEQGKVDTKPINAVYIYTRYSLKVPACVLPCGEPALVSRWSPVLYKPRADGPGAALPAAARMVLAVGTKRSILVYDTQQKTPIAIISNIHYTRLTDLSWSPDGRTLVASSTDGFCSVISFGDGELGELMPPPPVEVATGAPVTVATEPMEVQTEEVSPQPESVKEKPQEPPKDSKPKPITPRRTKSRDPKATTPKDKSTTPKIDAFIKFKAPEKSPKKQKIEGKVPKTPVKIDVLMETAMPSWSDNSNSEVMKQKENAMEVIEIEDSGDLKLVYEDTLIEGKTASPEEKKLESPKGDTPSKETEFQKQAKVTDVKEPAKSVPSPRAPRRVNFVTLSSPKNKKKC